MAAPDTGRIELDGDTRSALTDELFARHQALNPDGPGLGCFCGDDQDLVDAVMDARARMEAQAREVE